MLYSTYWYSGVCDDSMWSPTRWGVVLHHDCQVTLLMTIQHIERISVYYRHHIHAFPESFHNQVVTPGASRFKKLTFLNRVKIWVLFLPLCHTGLLPLITTTIAGANYRYIIRKHENLLTSVFCCPPSLIPGMHCVLGQWCDARLDDSLLVLLTLGFRINVWNGWKRYLI